MTMSFRKKENLYTNTHAHAADSALPVKLEIKTGVMPL